MSANNYIYLGIYGAFEPEVLAAKIGIEPTRIQAKHSLDAERGLPRTSILRFAQTHADEGVAVVDVYELAEAVYQKLKDQRRQIADVVKAHDVSATFQVVLEFPVSDHVSTPAIGFSDEVVNFISEVGASIGIDTYRA